MARTLIAYSGTRATGQACNDVLLAVRCERSAWQPGKRLSMQILRGKPDDGQDVDTYWCGGTTYPINVYAENICAFSDNACSNTLWFVALTVTNM